MGIQAAEALDHAHQMGIVHRDIKPSNLMLDERGKLWVTDFGLARNQGDASMTMTGDLVGTLRYMSPEQALAKRITVDHRTDIYSLGVTLYELLTLRPAFPSNDRQETLRQIAFEEPTAPRKLDKSIPEELKTIILKAMEKNPEDRYATARDVADDLQRWVEHKPIVARAPGIGRRAMKLTRRYAGIVTTASVALCILVIVLACSLLLLNTAFQKEAQQRQLAEFEANLGQEVLTNALEVIDRTILTLGVRELKRYPETQELQFRLVTDALSVCEKMLRDAGDVGAAVRVLNMTQYLARVERQRGNAEVAAALEERARAVVTELSEQSTRDPALAATLVDEITEGLALSDVAKHQSITADLLFQLLPQFRRIPQNSENFYLEALAAEGVSRSAELSNKNKLKLLADLVERGQVHEAGLLDQYLVPVAFSTLYQAMARLYEEDAENAMAAVAWGHAAEYQERFFRHSKQPGYGTVAARCLLEQAEVALPEDREELFAKALELAAPREREQAIATGQLAAVLLRQNKLQEAEKLATRSVEIWRLLLKESSGLDIQTWFPSNPTISLSYETLGEVLELKGERKEVASLFEEEITMWRKFTESVDPPDQVCVRELARAQFAYGAFEIVAGNRKEARPPYQSALNDTRQSLLQVSRYPRGLPALHRLLAYQLLMSPAVRWRDHQSAFAHLVEARSTSDNKEGVEYIEALHSLRTGNSAAAIETLRSHKPSMALALAYALVPDEDAAINVVSKVHVETEHIYSGRGGLREYEVQLRELAKILAIDVREMKLATPFLERWIRRPLPGKTD
ncbi:MAG: serine/threonine-protein kinase [Planctomycetia bacterium]|nr:serine/threonine-protein kinase [Planctomycetia bacterium]